MPTSHEMAALALAVNPHDAWLHEKSQFAPEQVQSPLAQTQLGLQLWANASPGTADTTVRPNANHPEIRIIRGPV